MSDSFSPMGPKGGIASKQHGMGKIGDTNTVMLDYKPEEFMQTLSSKNLADNTWIGTHCWPGHLPLDQFNKVLIVTTTTFKSKIYRWARAHYHYFSSEWKSIIGMELIDKSRETAKNYLVPFEPVLSGPNVLNVEFADIVETTQEFCYAINYQEYIRHMTRWKEVNYFLYAEDFWKSDVVKHFYQAELEVNLQRYYRYE